MASWSGPDPKPAKMIRASAAEWEALRAQFPAAVCVHCGLAAGGLHHILPRGQGGDDLAVNLAPMCGSGTTGCHGILECHSPGWERVAASVRQYVMQDNRRRHYQEDHAGESFNRRYPPLEVIDAQFIEDFERIYGRKREED